MADNDAPAAAVSARRSACSVFSRDRGAEAMRAVLQEARRQAMPR